MGSFTSDPNVCRLTVQKEWLARLVQVWFAVQE